MAPELPKLRDATRQTDMFWPTMLLACLAVAGVAFAGLALVAEFDRAAVVREQTVVANGIRGRMNEVAHLTDLVVVWDDAVRHLDNQFDPAWARDNIGTFLWQNSRFEASFILGPDNRPLLATNRGQPAENSFYTPFAASTASLVAAVRRVETEHARSPLQPHPGELVTEPNTASALDSIDGGVYILSATAVESDFGKATLGGPHAPIVVTAMRLDSRLLDAFSQRFLLAGVQLHTDDPFNRRSGAFVAFHNDRGAYVASLNWAPQTPGRILLSRIGVPALAILLGLISGIALLYRRARRAATALVTSEARATHLAYHDALTGLPNRVLFHDRLGHALKQLPRTGETLAVYCLDLDRFKSINDTYGHHIGDELIQKAGRVMAAHCRAGDTVARLSGDEFAIIQTGATAASAALLAARLTATMSAPIELQVGQVFIGCSIGITLVTDPGLEPAAIIRQADFALYRAKETAKGQFCFFEPGMDAAIEMRRALEADLRVALAEGQLHMAYQPQINDRTGLTGVEALMRWRHPRQGDISPAIFVPVAEECGLIVELGMFALRRVFEDSKRWKNLRVAVNISAKQLRMKNFVAKVMDLVAEVGVDPRSFELEITEGILLGDDPETHVMLTQLRKHGFELAFDDFGTGYSSLSYLQRYPINRIKIDQSFVANLGASAEAEAFIIAIVKLARALRLSVIAEGVETASQQHCLAQAGCTDMQGFLFSKPLPADEIDRLWAAPHKTILAA
jgi:diguanylate cyclase (GGDEF)-like protein